MAQSPEENRVLGYPPKVFLSILPRTPTVPDQDVDWRLKVTGVDRNVFFAVTASTSPLPGIQITHGEAVVYKGTKHDRLFSPNAVSSPVS